MSEWELTTEEIYDIAKDWDGSHVKAARNAQQKLVRWLFGDLDETDVCACGCEGIVIPKSKIEALRKGVGLE